MDILTSVASSAQSLAASIHESFDGIDGVSDYGHTGYYSPTHNGYEPYTTNEPENEQVTVGSVGSLGGGNFADYDDNADVYTEETFSEEDENGRRGDNIHVADTHLQCFETLPDPVIPEFEDEEASAVTSESKSNDREEEAKCKIKLQDKDNEAVIVKKERHNMAQEMMCSICIEIIVDTTSSVACGHMFCSSCIESVFRNSTSRNKRNARSIYPTIPCPICRVGMNSLVKCKSTDNVILSMVKLGFFPSDEAMHYLGRKGIALADDEMKIVMGQSIRPLKRKREKTPEDRPVAVPVVNPYARYPQYNPRSVVGEVVHINSRLNPFLGGWENGNIGNTAVGTGTTPDDAICID